MQRRFRDRKRYHRIFSGASYVGYEVFEYEKVFGAPDDDIGSGIHIYVYNLKDGTQVHIAYTDKLLSARHVDGNQFLDKII